MSRLNESSKEPTHKSHLFMNWTTPVALSCFYKHCPWGLEEREFRKCSCNALCQKYEIQVMNPTNLRTFIFHIFDIAWTHHHSCALSEPLVVSPPRYFATLSLKTFTKLSIWFWQIVMETSLIKAHFNSKLSCFIYT